MVIQNEVQSIIQTFCAQVIKATPKIATGIVIFIIVWIIAVIVKFFIVRLGRTAKNRIYLFKLIGSAVKIFIMIAGAISALGTMGINVSALVASLGLVGFALGFALKDSISNTLAGFLILFYQPFQVGDRIEITKIEGQVMNINLRYIVIKTDSEQTMIPNSIALNNPVTVKE